MNTQLQELRRLLLRHRAHWPYALAAAMLLAAAALWLFGASALDADNRRLAAAIGELARHPRATSLQGQGPLAQIQAYQARLPRADTAVEAVARIYDVGTGNGLDLPSGEYRLEKSGEAGLARYRLSLPVNGSYPQIRGFVLEVLRDMPAVALDDIQLKRDAKGGSLQARIRFSIFLLPA